MRLSLTKLAVIWRICGFATILVLLGGRLSAAPFNYQGRLVDSGILANGSYELRFRLFDQLIVGSQVGGDILLPAVSVTNGLFTVPLEFGPGVFTGASRWLELAARPAGSPAALEVFDPRQPVTAVPYALFALSGGSSDASILTTGTLPDGRLSLNIPRNTDVLSLSNLLTSGQKSGEAALQSQVNQESDRLDQLKATLPPIANIVLGIAGQWHERPEP